MSTGPVFTYQDALDASQRTRWTLEEILHEDVPFDLRRPFLPESLARTAGLGSLAPRDRLLLNQIRGHAYLCIFGLVEEFILPFVLDHARSQLAGDDVRTRALLHFVEEEAKHIHLFKRFRDHFARSSGLECEVIGPPADVAREVLSHGPLAVAITILHIEWMTQRHYAESIHGDAALEPQFARLLKSHWIEEAQHAQLDTLITRELAAELDARDVGASIDEYLEIGGALDGLLAKQVELDLDALERARGARLAPDQREEVHVVQRAANRWTYLGSGMSHPVFLSILRGLHPEGAERVRRAASAFS
ncbi:hypothetical protein [Sandaracinus amylolyticus]|uniref:hypothetical protein n=1 Tax=Sandaracinus amylolyticus TaxID=927083 RepID=UPI001F21F443|nr:hypothetical protein [Sandaracinus amylolyticus]UJR85895.1 Hypothetical protein I5071_79750 [Sandaracinus amylolyticus]